MSYINQIDNSIIDNSLIDEFNHSSDYLVYYVHNTLCEKYKMNSFNINSDDYGYHAYKCVIISILLNIRNEDVRLYIANKLPLDKYIGFVHSAWSDNYIKWKYMNKFPLGIDPTKTLNTYERNDRATTPINDIGIDDYNLYIDVIDVVLILVSSRMIEIGLKELIVN